MAVDLSQLSPVEQQALLAQLQGSKKSKPTMREIVSKGALPQIAPYLDIITDQSSGMMVGDLFYASAQDWYSVGALALTVSSGIYTLAANSSVSLFQAGLGDSATAQGFTTGSMGISETNNPNGSKQDANSFFLGLTCGFELKYAAGGATASNTPTNDGTAANLNPLGYNPIPFARVDDLVGIADALIWSQQIANGITRYNGSLLDWPRGAGGYGAANVPTDMIISATSGLTSGAPFGYTDGVQLGGPNTPRRVLDIPFMFFPNTKTNITVGNSHRVQNLQRDGAAPTISVLAGTVADAIYVGTVGYVIVKQVFGGIWMTSNLA